MTVACAKLSRDEELRLLRDARSPNPSIRQPAVDRLVASQIHWVYRLANRHPYSPTVDRNDLIQAGVVGLLEAIRRFDLTGKWRLNTYATFYIRSHMQGVIGDRLIRVSNRLQRAVQNKWNGTPLGKPAHLVDAAERAIRNTVSLSQDGCTLDLPEPAPQEQDFGGLDRLVADLPQRCREILRRMYVDDLPQTVVAKQLGLSTQRVQQLHAHAMDCLERRTATLAKG